MIPIAHMAETMNPAINQKARPLLSLKSLPPSSRAYCLYVFLTTTWYAKPSEAAALSNAQNNPTTNGGREGAILAKRNSAPTSRRALARYVTQKQPINFRKIIPC